jgi:anaerobic magnesium-protoporphyrin IX monomethyl ester cyclase
MKIALILPPINLEERYNKAIAQVAGSLPPIGLLSIGTILKEAGHKVIVLDGSITSLNMILKSLANFNPDIVGITAMTLMWTKLKKLSEEIKSRWPNTKIIVGGVHATLIKDKALAEVVYTDAVAWGEGEFSMLEFVETLAKGKLENPIAGIAFRGNAGTIIKGPDRPAIENLDELPIPDRTLVPTVNYLPAFEQYKKLPATNMVTTRGCPFQCLFCLPDLLGKKVRYRNSAKVLEEIEYLVHDFGIKDIAFWDDTFTLNKNRVKEICQGITDRKIPVIWSAQARADCVTQDMLDLMARAGCWKLFYGVESLVQKNLDMLNKGETVEQIFAAINMTHKAGIEIEGSFIFGIPGETYEEGLQTIMLSKKLDLDYAKFFTLSPYGRLLESVEKYGTITTRKEQDYHGNIITFVPFSMTKIELKKLYLKSYRDYYIRPRMIFKRLKKIGNIHELKKTIRGFFALLFFLFDEFNDARKDHKR